VDKKANDTFAFDLENRLDDFFSDALPSQNQPPADDPPEVQSNLPLKDLKSTILAIDWEITDDALEAFIDQVDALADQHADDKVVPTFLKLLKSLGKYIRTHKSKAHPDTIKRIMAVYDSLEQTLINDDLSRDQKEKMLQEEIRQFKQLKAKIIQSRSPQPSAVGQVPVQSEAAPGIEAVIDAIEELKTLMATELAAIRKTLGKLEKR
jgi:glycyl-tRNA synthetase beta subunit